MTANKRVTDRMLALGTWIRESAEQGLTDREIVTILVSQTVRIYKVVRREPSASAFLSGLLVSTTPLFCLPIRSPLHPRTTGAPIEEDDVPGQSKRISSQGAILVCTRLL